jgi:hypothetical protein
VVLRKPIQKYCAFCARQPVFDVRSKYCLTCLPVIHRLKKRRIPRDDRKIVITSALINTMKVDLYVKRNWYPGPIYARLTMFDYSCFLHATP